MAGKGQAIIKLNRDEVAFQDKFVDVKRFAYDVIKYTTIKFGLPEECISVWQGSENDYGCDDFCLVVTREIIVYQIRNRYHYFTSFDKCHERKGLDTFYVVGSLLHDVMFDKMASPIYDILDKTEISLSVLGELVLYLYTKDKDLYLKQLIDFWFDCHIKIKKRSFVVAGGLSTMYHRNIKPKFNRYDQFNDAFIKKYCLPYADTASNPNLKQMYNLSFGRYRSKNYEPLPSKASKDVEKELIRGDEVVKRQSNRKGYRVRFKIEGEAVPEPDETAKIDSNKDKMPEKSLLGISEYHEPSVGGGPSSVVVPPSQDLPGSSREGQPRHSGKQSAKEKMQLEKAVVSPSMEKSLGELSLSSSKPKSSMKKKATHSSIV